MDERKWWKRSDRLIKLVAAAARAAYVIAKVIEQLSRIHW